MKWLDEMRQSNAAIRVKAHAAFYEKKTGKTVSPESIELWSDIEAVNAKRTDKLMLGVMVVVIVLMAFRL